MDALLQEGIEIILFKLGQLRKNETCCLVTDTSTAELGKSFAHIAKAKGYHLQQFVIPTATMHGEEPTEFVADQMKKHDLVMGLTKFSLAHSKARHTANQNGARYLSLPDYNADVIRHPALRADYKTIAAKAKKIATQLTRGKKVHIKNDAGTNITLKIQGRIANFCPGFVKKGIPLGSPPDIEVNIAPLENGCDGVVVIDGSIPGPSLGKLKSPVKLTIAKGIINRIEGASNYKKPLEKLFKPHGAKGRVLAEFGIGLNTKAKLCGNMLIDEGCYGTFHFGFGSNATIGGKNAVRFHLDCVFYAKDFTIDGKLIYV